MPRLIKTVVTIHDEALEAIRRIETLAGLMRVIGHPRDAEPVEAALVSETAGMIRTETMHIREAVEAMRRLVPTSDETTSSPEKKSQTIPK
jgi:Tfp pilus assembly pilus retraction ATPase PilT